MKLIDTKNYTFVKVYYIYKLFILCFVTEMSAFFYYTDSVSCRFNKYL